MQRTHNGIDPSKGDIDTRFAPLIIVVRREWLLKMPEPYKTRLDEALTWTADTKFPDMVWTTPAYFTEWALRHYCHKGLLSDDVFEALERHIVAGHDDTNLPARSMSKIVDDRLVVDMTKSAGPFYMDAVAAIDLHYATRCRNLRPDQIP